MLSNKYSLKPPCPVCGGQPAIDRTIILILIIGLLAISGLYFAADYRAKSWNIICRSPNITLTTINPILRNNIQAAHTYTGQISNRDTLACIKADDYGELWGSSMQPTFFEGNTVLLKNYTTTTKLRTGDIIRYYRFSEVYPNCSTIPGGLNNSLGGAYVNNSMAVIHRINAIYDDIIITQGDNLNEQEVIQRCQITDILVAIIYT
jgi:hypothetical protein